MSVLTLAIIVFFIIHICVSDNAKDARTIFWKNIHYPDGGYFFRYQASNGIERGETGILRGEKNKPILQVIGYYSYPNDDGTIVKKAYLANEDGFRLYNLESQSYLPPTPDPAPIPTRVISTLQGGGIG